MRLLRRRPRPGRRFSTGLVALATAVAVTLGMAQPVQAATAVDVNNPQLQNRLFSAYMRLHSPGQNGLRDMVLSADLVGWRQKNPTATAEQMLQHTARMRSWFEEKLTAQDLARPGYEYTLRLLNVLAAHPEGAIAATAVRELLESTVGKDIKSYGAMSDYVAGSQFQYAWFREIYAIQDLVWGGVTRTGQADSAFRQAWDGAIGAGLNVSANATTDQLLADPMIATYVNVEALLAMVTDQNAYLTEGQRQLSTALKLISDQNDTTLERLRLLNEKFPVSANGPRPTEAVQQEERAAAAERQKVLDGAATAVELLATLLGFADPRAGKVAAGVGKAAIQVATAINNFLPAVAGLSLKDAIFSMSTLTLTGNLVGAIASLLPLFSGVQTPEAAMLEELRAIRADIVGLRTNMNERFDRIEQGLTTIYSDMISKFDDILELQNATNAQLQNLETQLLRLSPQLDMWGAELVKGQQEQIMYDTNVGVNKYIDYHDRYGQPIPSYNSTGDRYTEPEALLRTTATTLANRAPLTGPSTTWGSADPVAALNTWEANGTLGYLEWLASSAYGLPTSTTLTKPNPATWAYSARAYGLLQIQNPQYASQVSATEPAKIISVGQDILTVNRALSRPKAAGTDGRRTNVLFTGLARDYLSAADDLKGKLEAVRKRHSDNKEYNLFGSIDQAMPDVAKLQEPANVQSCTNQYSWLSRPSNVSLAGAPTVFAFAQYAHSDAPKVSLCFDAGLVNIRRSSTTKFYITRADLRVQMRLRVQWGTEVRDFRTWTTTTPLGETCREYRDSGETAFCYTLEDYLANWDSTYKGPFQTSATYGSNPQVETDVRSRMTNFLAGRRSAYYGQVHDDLRNGATDLYRSNAQLTKMAKLIKAYTALGFGRSLQHDDLLRGLIHGSGRIVADDGDGDIVKDTFAVASQAYANCNAPSRGAPCTAGNGAFDPLTGQPHLSDCAAGGWSEESWDPVGNCVLGKAKIRHGLLTQRYEAASVAIAGGAYVEGMPEVEDLITSLNTIDASVRG